MNAEFSTILTRWRTPQYVATLSSSLEWNATLPAAIQMGDTRLSPQNYGALTAAVPNRHNDSTVLRTKSTLRNTQMRSFTLKDES